MNMKTLSFFTFFLGLSFSFWAVAQYNKVDSVWVLLETKNTFAIPKITQPARPLQKNNAFQFKGIPMGLDTFLVYDADFQPRQGFHERFLSGEVDSAAYQKMTLRYRLKNKKLYQKPFKHQVHILSGRKNQQKIIICDANNNYDFGDDRILVYDFKQKYQKFEPDSLEDIMVQYEYFLRNQIVKQTSVLKIKPFDKSYRFPDSLQQDLSIFYSVAEHQVGSFTSDNKSFKIKTPFLQGSGGHDYSYGALFTLYDANDVLINLNPILKLGDAYSTTAKERVKFQYISEMGDSLLIISTKTQLFYFY